MSDTVTVRLDDDQINYLESRVKSGGADSVSEAARQAIRGNGRTPLQMTARRMADATALLGLFWVGLTFLYPLFVRLFAIPIFSIALGLYGFDRVLGWYEPRVSDRLRGFFGGSDA